MFFYSMMVDDIPTHKTKLNVLLSTLRHLAGIPIDNIIINFTDRVPSYFIRKFEQQGYTTFTYSPYLDGTYCNKIRMLSFYDAINSKDYHGAYFMDVDMAVLSPIILPRHDIIWGKIVDAPNPPIHVLKNIFSTASLPFPRSVSCDWGAGLTFETNLNGGLYYIPSRHIRNLAEGWRRWAKFLYENEQLFESASQRIHIDQISFALTMTEGRFPLGHLNANWNFPCHNDLIPKSLNTLEQIHILHYHDCINDDGLVVPRVKHSHACQQAVDKLNGFLIERGLVKSQ